MFRALLFPPNEKYSMEAPIAITLLNSGKEPAPTVPLSIQSEAIFTTAVGPSSKRTLARWHVTTPQEILEHMLDLVKDDHDVSTTTAAMTTSSIAIQTAAAIGDDV
jgi:trehalose 6-phosphate synthase/phosphatase